MRIACQRHVPETVVGVASWSMDPGKKFGKTPLSRALRSSLHPHLLRTHMHHSRLSTFVIDCQTGEVAQAAKFWSNALGRPMSTPEAEADTYRDLVTKEPEFVLMVQAVEHPSRIHLDIETD